jgi:hypothetical protein
MVPRDEADDRDLLGLETAQPAVPDQVVRMLVMPFVADVRPDVVEQRAVLEPVAFALAQPVARLQAVEHGERKTRDLLGVRREIVAPLGQLDHAAAPDVGIAIDGANVPGVALDVIEHEPLAQREIAKRDLVGAQALEDRVKEE